MHGAFGSNLCAILCIREGVVWILWLLLVTALFKRCRQTAIDHGRMRTVNERLDHRGLEEV